MKWRLFIASFTVLLFAAPAYADVVEPFGKIDVTPPIISDVSVSTVSVDSATLAWTTNEVANSIVRYGVAPATDQSVTQTTFVLAHSLTLTGLEPGKAYNFCIDASDMARNLATSCDHSFTTDSPAVSDETGPTISDVAVNDIGTESATVTWTTDEIATGQAEYGTTDAYGQQSALTDTLDTLHSITISGLAAHTTYHIRVHSKDDSGNMAQSSDIAFTTDASAEPATQGPVISKIESKTSLVKAIISWSTDVPADAQIEYGDDTGYGHTTALQTALTTNHVVLISGLSSDTLYHARISSRDADGVLAVSDDFTFQTAQDVTEPPIVPGNGDVNDASGSGAEPTPPSEITITESPAATTGGVGLAGGAPLTASVSAPEAKVQNVSAYGLDHTVILTWNKAADQSFAGAVIVRSDTHYPLAPGDGMQLYAGSGRIFTDTNLTNNKTYYYSIFATGQQGGFAAPVELSIAPIANPNTYSTVRIEEGRINILTTADFGAGTRGAVVEYLQKLLATDPQLYPEGLVTGYYGPLTESAVKRFQAANNIPQTGTVDAEVRAVAQNLPLAQRVAEKGAARTDLKLGSHGENVKVLQIALVQFGYLAEDSITSYFGPVTRDAVAKFQADNGITPAVGYFGTRTRQKIFQKTAAPVSGQ